MKHYVLLCTDTKTGEVKVVGSRHAEPFTNEVNAQRSLSKRAKNKRFSWELREVVSK